MNQSVVFHDLNKLRIRHERLDVFYYVKNGIGSSRHRYIPAAADEDGNWYVFDTAYRRFLGGDEIDNLSDIELMRELVA